MKNPLLILAALAALFALPLPGQVPAGSIGITVKNAGPGSSVLWLPPTPDHVLGLDEEGTWTVKEAGASASTFLALTDTPASYDGHAWKSVRVNPTGDGLEFFTPAMGSGTELQFNNGGFFGAVANSSVTGGRITLGGAESLNTTPTAYLTLRNASSASAGAQQVSPSLVWEGRGWRTNTAASSQEVRFRANVLPVQGAANPSATWRLQSEINNSGTWGDALQVQSDGRILAQSGTGYPQYTVTGTTGNGFRVVSDRMDFWISGSPVAVFVPGALDMAGSFVNWGATVGMHGGADGGALAFRAGVNAQEMHVANTYTSFTNKEFGILGWRAAANIFTVGTAKGSGGGTARAMSLVTDGVNRLTIDALGRIIPVLPTSAAGLPPGALWNDAGTVKVAP